MNTVAIHARAPSDSRNLFAAFLVISASLIQAISIGINAVVLPTTLLAYGASSSVIGLVLAIEFVSVFAIAFGLTRLLRFMSLYTWLLISTLVRLPAIALIAYFTDIPSWLLLVFLHGAGSILFGTLLQTWLNSIPFARSRGLAMAALGTSVSLGLALGPIVLYNLGSFGWLIEPAITQSDQFLQHWFGLVRADGIEDATRVALFASALLSMLAAVPLLLGRVVAPRFERTEQGSLIRTIRLAPAAMFATAVCGVSIFGIQSFITVYGISNGLTLVDASLLLSAFMLGAIVLEMPFGWISDIFDRRYVMIVLVLMSLAAAVYLPIAIYDPWGARGLLFIWGGVIGGLYSICLAVIAERFSGPDLVAANGAISVMDAAGGMFGILAIGVAMDLFDMDGLPYVIMLAGVLYFSFALTRYRVR
jgi:MFS family permease